MDDSRVTVLAEPVMENCDGSLACPYCCGRACLACNGPRFTDMYSCTHDCSERHGCARGMPRPFLPKADPVPAIEPEPLIAGLVRCMAEVRRAAGECGVSVRPARPSLEGL